MCPRLSPRPQTSHTVPQLAECGLTSSSLCSGAKCSISLNGLFLTRWKQTSVQASCAKQRLGAKLPGEGRAPLWARPTLLSRPRPPVLGGLPLPRRPEPSAHSCVQLGGAGGFCFLPSPAARGGRGRLAGFTSSGPAPARRHSRGEGVRPGSRIRGSQSRRMGQWARRKRGARRRPCRVGGVLKPGAPAPPCSPRSPASAPPLQGPPLVVGGGGMRAPALGGGGREPRSLRWTRSRFFPAGAEAAAPAAQEACTQQGATPGDLRDAAPIPQAADPPRKLASVGQGDGGLWTLLGQQPRGGAGAPLRLPGASPAPRSAGGSWC